MQCCPRCEEQDEEEIIGVPLLLGPEDKPAISLLTGSYWGASRRNSITSTVSKWTCTILREVNSCKDSDCSIMVALPFYTVHVCDLLSFKV
jgi:hypothetical protein